MSTTALTTVNMNGFAGKPMLSKAGNVIGAYLPFTGDVTASKLKADLKSKGLKGAKLKAEVNAVLTGAKDIAWAKHDAAVSLLRSGGYIPDYVAAKRGGATARFVRPDEAKVTVTREEALAALGLSEAALNAMLK